MNLEGKRIIISRTDSIGDVMLTLPLCHWLKQQAPSCHIIFLGKGYTKAVVESYKDVDQFEDWGNIQKAAKDVQLTWMQALQADVIIHVFPNKEVAALAKKARVGMRIGTSHRLYHLWTCTHKVSFSRKKSDLHEAQLNFELLRPLGLTAIPDLTDLVEATSSFQPPKLEPPDAFNNLQNFVILHPKSQGSAREWPMENYLALAQKLVAKGKTVVFTGTENEGEQFRDVLPKDERVIDTTGKLSLPQLIALIGQSEGLIACSTGPLHIAGFLGVKAVGLFSPKRPIHPGRWKALGPKVTILVNDSCEACAKGETCNCMETLPVEDAFNALTS